MWSYLPLGFINALLRLLVQAAAFIELQHCALPTLSGLTHADTADAQNCCFSGAWYFWAKAVMA
jgi:hypothetical protein